MSLEGEITFLICCFWHQCTERIPLNTEEILNLKEVKNVLSSNLISCRYTRWHFLEINLYVKNTVFSYLNGWRESYVGFFGRKQAGLE